jgi:predicted Fe-Mo cluster-binding NifX family protein
MIIAVPTCAGRFTSHFGGAEAFALYTVDLAGKAIESAQVGVPPEHGHGVFPLWLRNQGVTTVIAGGMGPRAAAIFHSQGIEVVLGAEGDDPEAMVRAYLEGTLSTSGELCQDHGFHDCGHHQEAGGRGGCRH